jgi:hypothetical protein
MAQQQNLVVQQQAAHGRMSAAQLPFIAAQQQQVQVVQSNQVNLMNLQAGPQQPQQVPQGMTTGVNNHGIIMINGLVNPLMNPRGVNQGWVQPPHGQNIPRNPNTMGFNPNPNGAPGGPIVPTWIPAPVGAPHPSVS